MEPWIPLLQTLVWPLVVLGVVLTFRAPLMSLLHSIRGRVEAGGEVELAGPAGIRARLAQLPQIEPGQGATTEPDPDWTMQRGALHDLSRNVFLAHVLSPSGIEGQAYEVYAFLVGHRRARKGYPDDLSDVVRAEFYLGGGWGRQVFDIPHPAGQGSRVPHPRLRSGVVPVSDPLRRRSHRSGGSIPRLRSSNRARASLTKGQEAEGKVRQAGPTG